MHLTSLLFSLCLATASAQQRGPSPDELAPEPLPVTANRALPETVACEEGSLRDAVQLPELPDLYVRLHADRAWGRPELIEVLLTGAEAVERLLPDADPITIGDLSTRYGGPLSGHKSHRGGIDADVGLFWHDGDQPTGQFVNGSPRELDMRANWLFIQAMLDTGLVDRILLDQAHIEALRTWTVQNGELTEDQAWAIFPAAGSRTWAMTGVVVHATNHRDHMHVRVLCEAS